MKPFSQWGVGRAVLAVSCLVGATALAVSGLGGCETRKPPTNKGTTSDAAVAVDAEATALAPLETEQDSGRCRTVLQQLDSLPSAAERPTLSESERADLARFLRLTPAEVAEITQTNYSTTDSMYVSECLLLRAAVKSLRLDARPPLEQARLSFDWVCRMIYIDDRVPWPVNPWLTFQVGWGCALSRTYAVLATWQQLGLDCCLVGPPALRDTASVTVNPEPPVVYAPVRACGVKVGKDVYLFDPAAGQPYKAADGKGILTLAEAKARPALVPGLKPADEAKDWRPFVALPLAALSPRMHWLEKFNPGSAGVKLHLDVAKLKSAFAAEGAETPCDAWNPEGDVYSATRVLGRVVTEELSERNKMTLRDLYKFHAIPLRQMPKTSLEGVAKEYVLQIFAQPFDALRYAPHTPRDLVIRGQFQQAMQSLDRTKEKVENAQIRMLRDKTLQKDFDQWAERFRHLYAELNLARERSPADVPAATRAFEGFRNHPVNLDIERAFVLGHAAQPLDAEVKFLMATCIHERAERSQLDNPAHAAGNWTNAAEWWNRFLDASARAQSPFPAREPHARAMLARCQQFAGK